MGVNNGVVSQVATSKAIENCRRIFEKYINSESKMFKMLVRLVFLEVLDAKRSWK